MKNIFIKVKDFLKTYKKKIITLISICILTAIIGVGVTGGVIYSKAKANTNYSQEQLQQIALGKVPGDVVKVEKRLNFEEAVYVYEFRIKDKENMLQVVKLDAQSGAILRVNNGKSRNEKFKGEKFKNERMGKDREQNKKHGRE